MGLCNHVAKSTGHMFGTYALLPGRRASFGAITLEKLICFSGGGPPLGGPRMITESPDKTFVRKTFQINVWFNNTFLSELIIGIASSCVWLWNSSKNMIQVRGALAGCTRKTNKCDRSPKRRFQKEIYSIGFTSMVFKKIGYVQFERILVQKEGNFKTIVN